MHDPLWDEIEAFICRTVRLPRRHRLGPQSLLGRDFGLSARDQADLIEQFLSFFRVQRGDLDLPRAAPGRWIRWVWPRAAAHGDISLDMLLQAARRGRWIEQELRPMAPGVRHPQPRNGSFRGALSI